MKQFYFLVLILLSTNLYSQCPNPDIFWFETGEDFAFINGNNNGQIDYYEIEYKATKLLLLEIGQQKSTHFLDSRIPFLD